MRLLIVEDEEKTAAYLKKGLSESGFIVDHANNGEDGVYLATQTPYDLIILDVTMPKLSGWEVIQRIRAFNSSILVLFLTARDDVNDKVKGLELGADDYLVKPFAFSELLARVRTLLRRQGSQPQDVLQIADLRIEINKHKAYRSGARLNLTPKEFSLLTLLAQRQSEVLSRTLIAELVWDIHFDCDTNIVDVAIRRLRQKVDDDFSQKLIHTVWGMGYVLEAR